jgi:hypothetical protein
MNKTRLLVDNQTGKNFFKFCLNVSLIDAVPCSTLSSVLPNEYINFY